MNEEYEKWKTENSEFLRKYIEEEIFPNIKICVDNTQHTFNLSLINKGELINPIKHFIAFYPSVSDFDTYSDWSSTSWDITIDGDDINS